MYKQASYTKYQKKVIKFLSDTLGVDTPFSYERAQNNHLKVLIDGVSCPLFTGSTPSDSKAINNFMAEVKRKVAQSKQQELGEKLAASLTLALPTQHSLDKTIQTCLKSLRPRIDMMKVKEEELVLSSTSLDGVREYRINEIKNAIALAKQAQKATVYLKPKEMKTLELKILEHVDFWMPTLAYYADLVGNKENVAEPENKMNHIKKSELNNVVILEEISKSEPKKERVLLKSKSEMKANTGTKKIQIKNSLTKDLMQLSSSKRIDLLRTLSRAEAQQLVDEINQALSMNREQDIMEVVSMIKEKGLQIEEIISKINVV